MPNTNKLIAFSGLPSTSRVIGLALFVSYLSNTCAYLDLDAAFVVFSLIHATASSNVFLFVLLVRAFGVCLMPNKSQASRFIVSAVSFFIPAIDWIEIRAVCAF